MEVRRATGMGANLEGEMNAKMRRFTSQLNPVLQRTPVSVEIDASFDGLNHRCR